MWGGVRGGFHHNSKEFDEDAELVYMYQRWYLPEVGVFVSSAPYPPMVEHRFGFAEGNPQMLFDSVGELPSFVDISKGPHSACLNGQVYSWSKSVLGYFQHFKEDAENNAVRHCTWQCMLARVCGKGPATTAGWGHELGRPNDADHKADVINNEIGRNLSDRVCSTENCYKACRNAWRNGRLADNSKISGGSYPSVSRSGYTSGYGGSDSSGSGY